MPSRVVLGVIVVALLGCAHGHLDPATARIPGPVGRLEVVTVPDLEEDRIARYRELDAGGVIRDAIEDELRNGGLWQSSADVAVTVTVTNFRLRSTGNAFWNGFFAGSDLLDGRINVRAAGDPEQITFKFSGNEDEYFKFSAAARLRSLARELASEVRKRVEAR